MIRVLVVDDEELVRSGIAAVVDSAEDVGVVGEAADGPQALGRCRELVPDVVLLDLAMPGPPGLEVAARLRELRPDCAVVVLTTFDRDTHVAEALASGLAGFVLKASGPEELLHAVRVAAAGGTYVSPRITERLLATARPTSPPAPELSTLTRREGEVLRSLARGESNHGIARELGLSEATVKVHVKAVLRKLGVDSRVRAALIAHRAGWDENS